MVKRVFSPPLRWANRIITFGAAQREIKRVRSFINFSGATGNNFIRPSN